MIINNNNYTKNIISDTKICICFFLLLNFLILSRCYRHNPISSTSEKQKLNIYHRYGKSNLIRRNIIINNNNNNNLVSLSSSTSSHCKGNIINTNYVLKNKIFNSNSLSIINNNNHMIHYSSNGQSDNTPLVDPQEKALDIKLYQYQNCPYCSKVRTYLKYQNLNYSTIEVDPISKKEIKFSEYRKVPILILNGKQINGSSIIIRDLNKQVANDKKVKGTVDDDKWCQWVDDKLVKSLPPNIYRTVGETLQTTNYISQNKTFSLYQKLIIRYIGAFIMYFISKKMRTKYGIEKGKEREALYTLIDEWILGAGIGNRNGKKGKMFFGGKKPSLADIEVFGVLSSIKGMDTWTDMMAKTDIDKWYTDMEKTL